MIPTLLHVFPTFVVGGSQMRFAALANRFGRRFCHVVVAMDGRTECRERLRNDLDIAFPKVSLRARDTLGNLRRFRRLLQEVQPQRLITYNWGSIECAMANWPGLAGHVHIEDGFGPEEAKQQLPRRVLTRRYVLGRSMVVLPSQTLYRLASDVWRLKPTALRYIPNGIDCARFGAPGLMPMHFAGEGPAVGTVAALRPEKNLIRLIDAFHLVRDRMSCRLIIAGDGPERERLQAHAISLGLGRDVTFTGQITETEKIYAGLNVLALSSDTEQLPTAVLEAMAARLPVASTNVGDVRQMVSEENRAFVTGLDHHALADAIWRLLSDQDAAARIGAANREVACARFDQESMFAAYEALFEGGRV